MKYQVILVLCSTIIGTTVGCKSPQHSKAHWPFPVVWNSTGLAWEPTFDKGIKFYTVYGMTNDGPFDLSKTNVMVKVRDGPYEMECPVVMVMTNIPAKIVTILSLKPLTVSMDRVDKTTLQNLPSGKWRFRMTTHGEMSLVAGSIVRFGGQPEKVELLKDTIVESPLTAEEAKVTIP